MNITTLIPAYKTKYIVELLNSLRYQTQPSQRILISDDSPNGEFRQELNSERIKPLLAGLNIDVIEGPRKGAYENFKHLLRLWNNGSDLVHMMLDDDVAYPEFYERHLVAHASADLSCTISRRWTSAENGWPLAGQPVPGAVANNPSRILSLDADVVFMTTVPECKNWFGEFSNTVMRADTCALLLKPEMGGVSYAGLWDLGYFLAASMLAPIGYIQDHLGYFRTGGTGNSSSLLGPFMKGAVLGYVALGLGGQRVGKLSREQVLKCYGIIASVLNRHYGQEEDMQIFCKILPEMTMSALNSEDQFMEAWAIFRHNNGF
jgi:hypothetical protein